MIHTFDLALELVETEYAAEDVANQDLVLLPHKGYVQHSRPAAQGPKDRLKQLLDWKKDRIWVINDTDESVLVYVHRFRKIKEVLERTVKLSGSAVGEVAGEVAMKAALENDLVQAFSIAAQDKQMVRVNLGPRSGGAYVTVRSKSSSASLFCKDILVEGGRCATIRSPAFVDQVLQQGPLLNEEVAAAPQP
eukprot:gene8843-9022_t